MKITAISDLHGNLIDIEPCDILLICGDISPLNIQIDYIQMIKWIFNEFKTWIELLPCKQVVMTPGNHDYIFQLILKEGTLNLFKKLTILVDDTLSIVDNNKKIKIYGTPQCKDFGRWAYMPGNKKLYEIYSKIPNDIDILICHDSPQIGYVANIMEHKSEDYPNGIPAGNPYLLDTILEKKPKYVLSGHIHSGDHNLTEIEGIKVANVSILDENYNINYKPLIFEI